MRFLSLRSSRRSGRALALGTAFLVAPLGARGSSAVSTPEFELAELPGKGLHWVGGFHRYAQYSDVWGYTAPDGRELAVLGTKTGISILDVTPRRGLAEVAFFTSTPSNWRDFKTYDHYLYEVNESAHGLRIFDLEDPTDPQPIGSHGGFTTAHNLFIDVETARAYVAGSNATDGVRIYDLTDPRSPALLGTWTRAYAHDVYARGDLMLVSGVASEPNPSLYLVDVSDPSSPLALGEIENYPHPATHNAWLTEDGTHVLVTDEIDGGMTRMWNITDPANPVMTDSYLPNRASRSIPHNVHVEGNLAFISHYTAGVSVVDLTDPWNLREVAWWDTYPQTNGPFFHGVWGVYAHFPNSPSLVLASDITSGLYLFELDSSLLPAAAGGADSKDETMDEASVPGRRMASAIAPRLGHSSPHPVRAGEIAMLALEPGPPGPLLVRVYDAAGRRVRTLFQGEAAEAGAAATWDGRNEAGRRVAAGTYFVRATGVGGEATRRVVVLR